jgi:hypothetical protein
MRAVGEHRFTVTRDADHALTRALEAGGQACIKKWQLIIISKLTGEYNVYT